MASSHKMLYTLVLCLMFFLTLTHGSDEAIEDQQLVEAFTEELSPDDRQLGHCRTVYKWTYDIRRPRRLFHNGVQPRYFRAVCTEHYNKVDSYDVHWYGDCEYDKEDCSIKSGHTVECTLKVSRERKGCYHKYVDALLEVECCT